MTDLTEYDRSLEEAIEAAADFQRALGADQRAFKVGTMVALLKGMRRPEIVSALDAARLERARAA